MKKSLRQATSISAAIANSINIKSFCLHNDMLYSLKKGRDGSSHCNRILSLIATKFDIDISAKAKKEQFSCHEKQVTSKTNSGKKGDFKAEMNDHLSVCSKFEKILRKTFLKINVSRYYVFLKRCHNKMLNQLRKQN